MGRSHRQPCIHRLSHGAHNPLSKYRTKKMIHGKQHYGDFVALDCEMVGVGQDGQRSALGRVSIVASDGSVLLDTYVRVAEKVTDYRTFVSGIKPADLISPTALDFLCVRSMVENFICGKILVGHGLKNDLDALKLQHPWHLIRDTSLYEPFMIRTNNGFLRSQRLRTLTYQYLGRTIQQAGSCHNSCVDAWAAMELYRLVQRDWENWWRNHNDFAATFHKSVSIVWDNKTLSSRSLPASI